MSVRAAGWPAEDPLATLPELSDASVHVWCCSLDEPPLAPALLLKVLSSGERERAERYFFERDRMRSVASRGLLRWLLGAYLHVRSPDVQLRLGVHGKPELTSEDALSGLSFNVAHSEEVVIYAVTIGREVGVDVEQLRPMPDATGVATRFFAQSEITALRALAHDQVDEGFFVCWTRKEAYVKARGVGLALPLDEFEVRLDRGEGSDRLRIPGDPEQAEQWALHDLQPLPGFIGALAVRGHTPVQRFQWTRSRPTLPSDVRARDS